MFLQLSYLFWPLRVFLLTKHFCAWAHPKHLSALLVCRDYFPLLQAFIETRPDCVIQVQLPPAGGKGRVHKSSWIVVFKLQGRRCRRYAYCRQKCELLPDLA